MKKVLSMVLALAMLCTVFAFSACDKEAKEKEETVSIVNVWEGTVDMTELFRQAMGAQFSGNITSTVTVEFKADGTYAMTMDAETVNASLAAALNMTVEDLKANGIGYNGEETKGEYSYENNVLTLDGDQVTCELTAKTLKISDSTGLTLELKKK